MLAWGKSWSEASGSRGRRGMALLRVQYCDLARARARLAPPQCVCVWSTGWQLCGRHTHLPPPPISTRPSHSAGEESASRCVSEYNRICRPAPLRCARTACLECSFRPLALACKLVAGRTGWNLTLLETRLKQRPSRSETRVLGRFVLSDGMLSPRFL